MRFYKHLYVGESLKKKKNSIKWKLSMNKFLPDVFIVVLSQTVNEIEFFKALQLKQRYFKRQDFFVVGIASSEEECQEIVVQIAKDSALSPYPYELKKFLIYQNGV